MVFTLSIWIATLLCAMVITNVVNDIHKYIQCYNCYPMKLHNVDDTSLVDGLFIVSKDCVQNNQIEKLFYIGGTNKYYVIFTKKNINSFCHDYLYYYSKFKEMTSIYDNNESSRSIVISVITNQRGNKEIIKKYFQDQLYKSMELDITNTQYDYNHFFNNNNELISSDSPSNHELLYIQLECPMDLIMCADLLSYNKYIYELSAYQKSELDTYMANILRNEEGHKYAQHPDGIEVIWNHGLHGEDTIIGCSDSGLDINSCFFSDNTTDVLFSSDKINNHRKIAKYNNYADNSDYYIGHGTHVVGTILGELYPNTKYNGISYSSRVAFDDIGYSRDPKSVYPPNDIGQLLLEPSKNVGVRIHTNSWGHTPNVYDLPAQQIDDFIYKNPDFNIIFSSGNKGPHFSTVSSPSVCKNCISVGASLNANYNKYFPDKRLLLNVAVFSSRGPTADGRIKPDIIAPGYPVMSAFSSGNDTKSCLVVENAGTSMAAPLVAGAISLIRQYLVEGFYPSGERNINDKISDPRASLLKAMTIHSGRKMTGYQDIEENIHDMADFPSNIQGFGLLTLTNVLKFKGDEESLYITTKSVSTTKNFHSYNIRINNNTKPIKVTLVWTDPATTWNSRRVLLNNLDLNVKINDVIHYPNSLDKNDNDNNIEVVWLDKLPPNVDNVNITIHGESLSTDDQEYSLVITGYIDRPSILMEEYAIGNENKNTDEDAEYNKKEKSYTIYYVLIGILVVVVIIIVVFFAFIITKRSQLELENDFSHDINRQDHISIQVHNNNNNYNYNKDVIESHIHVPASDIVR